VPLSGCAAAGRPGGWVVLGSTPWETAWGADQNLAHALARRGPALYVDPPISPLTPVRYGLSARTVPALRELARRRRVGTAGMRVVRPLALPPVEDPRARQRSRPLVRAQVRRAARWAGVERPVLVAMRSLLDVAGALDEAVRVFVVMDWFEDAAELVGKDPAEILAEVDAMCAAADLVVCTSTQLRETLAARGVEARLLRHGFPADLAPAYDAAEPPPEYAGLPRPLFAVVGRVDARLHFEALAALADAFPEGSLALVGPQSPRLPRVEVEPLEGRPNVHLLGERPRERLPAYLVHADCLLLPYRESAFARHGSPLRLGEHLYAGPPVVGSGYPSLRDFPRPLVELAGQDPDDLPRIARQALASDTEEGRAERRRYALANSWDARAHELEEMVEALLKRPSG
jgi:teichuronic acid biosynthesis glycosyltransferase TuaH